MRSLADTISTVRRWRNDGTLKLQYHRVYLRIEIHRHMMVTWSNIPIEHEPSLKKRDLSIVRFEILHTRNHSQGSEM